MTKTTMSDAAGLERDPWQPVGIPCPECRCRPALRGNKSWSCQNCHAEFTLADVLRSLWKPKS